jgi:hypothetical protein
MQHTCSVFFEDDGFKAVRRKIPALRELESYINTKLGKPIGPESIDQVRELLATKLCLLNEEVNLLPAKKAVHALRRGSPSIVDASGSKHEVPATDYDALADQLAKPGMSNQAALVRFMKNKTAADVEEIAEKVHGNSDVSEGAIAKNARRTSESLAEMGVPLSFRVARGMIHKEISPE